MNHRKYLNSATLKADPLCGIDTYKDTLNLASGQTTRKIKKLVLDGTENISINTKNDDIEIVQFYVPISDSGTTTASNVRSTHFERKESASQTSTSEGVAMRATGTAIMIGISFSTSGIVASDSFAQAKTKIASYLAAQYASGTPVTVWYVLASPETEQIAVPSGLSGTLEGLLTQSGTPTPSAPIYPSAVTGEGWYNINTYKRSVLVWNTDTAYERDSGAWT